MNANNTLQAFLKNEMELLRAQISNIGIIDIGTIISVDEKGRALVHGSSFIGGEQATYEDAEIVYPGNDAGTYSVESPGTACLIFIPRSCMPNTTSKNVRFSEKAYSKAGVKVMPIGNGSNDRVRTVRTGSGNFGISASLYNVLFEDMGCSIGRKDGAASVGLDPNGAFHVIQQSDRGTYYKDLEDGTASQTWLSADKDVKWTDTFNSDGSRSFVQTDADDNELFSISISADGTASVNMKKGLSLTTEDDLLLKGKSVSIESTSTTVSITSKTNTTIDTGNGSTLAVNGDNLVVE